MMEELRFWHDLGVKLVPCYRIEGDIERSKQPTVKWTPIATASSQTWEEVQELFPEGRELNVGACIPIHWLVFDCENAEAAEKLLQAIPDLNNTLRYRTGSGGQHIVVLKPEDWEISIGMFHNAPEGEKVSDYAQIEIRYSTLSRPTHYNIVPPSKTLGEYVFLNKRAPSEAPKELEKKFLDFTTNEGWLFSEDKKTVMQRKPAAVTAQDLALFTAVKKRITLKDVAPEIEWRPDGTARGKCPKHRDSRKHPNPCSYHEVNGFYCHSNGCGACGDAIDYYALRENLSKTEAALKLAKKYNIDVPKQPEQAHKKEGVAPDLEKVLYGVELFHDQFQEVFAVIEQDGVKKNLHIRGREFKKFLLKRLQSLLGEIPNKEVLSNYRDACEALAQEAQKELFVRVAVYDGAIWLDLCNNAWQAVRITPEGWSVEDHPPILFRRYAHMLPLEVAADGTEEDLDAYIELLNLSDDDNKLLAKVWISCALVPGIPHPILSAIGPQGSCKTTALKALRKLVDNSRTLALSLPREGNELIQQLAHHYLPVFDNVHELEQWQSDALCRAVTGEGFSKRMLYSDDDDYIYSYRRVVAVNGISTPGTAPDYLDRNLILEFQRVPKTRRRKLQEIEDKLDALAPQARAFLFKKVSEAMKLERQENNGLPQTNLPRMADFAYFGEAHSRAMGYAASKFFKAYEENQAELIKVAVDNSLLGDLVREFAESKALDASGNNGSEPQQTLEDGILFKGSPTEFYNALTAFAETKQINVKTKEFPKAANSLTRSLGPLIVPLTELGFQLLLPSKTNSREKNERILQLKKVPLGENS